MGLFDKKRPKSALMRDRKYFNSSEKHEVDYAKSNKRRKKGYSKYAKGGGVGKNYEIEIIENSSNKRRWKGVVSPLIFNKIESLENEGGFKRYDIDLYDDSSSDKADNSGLYEFMNSIGIKWTSTLPTVDKNRIERTNWRNGGGIRGWFSRKPKGNVPNEYEVFVTRKDGTTDNPIFGSQQAAQSHKSNMEKLGYTAIVKPIYSKGGGVDSVNFNEDVSKWYDLVISESKKKKNKYTLDAIETANSIASKNNLKRFSIKIKLSNFSKKTQNYLLSQIKNIFEGNYKNEFKNMFGGSKFGNTSSATKEFFSLFNQAATYHTEYAKGGSIRKNKNWISKALTGKKGALRKTAMSRGLLRNDKEKLSMTDLRKLQKVGTKTSKRAYLAETLRSFEGGGRVYKKGLAYKLDRAKYNKNEEWEKPVRKRKSKYRKG